ncbi:WcbI family polysaccharide biosynthesis putative acetyltransferase [Salipiger sp.]|uniref:WcbI family polysaccharide biosynthesis putative acetyltransferase n=1 Tax=Salipiger sp. TaxID=2078585 RepID=UPI003A97899D
MSKVLVVSNCATPGLVAGLRLLCPGLEVEGYEIAEARADPAKLRQDAARSDQLVLLPGVAELLGARLAARKPSVTVPTFFFSGYHPDTVYLEDGAGQQIVTDYGAYHSLIGFAAWQAGLSEADTARLYRGPVYQELGYFDEWDRQKALLLSRFAEQGIDLTGPFLGWLRGGCFMYTINHPQARCLLDLARLVARQLGAEPLAYDIVPRDMLVSGSVYPCYPEIAEACGAQGSLLFKMSGKDRLLDLPQFLRQSFACYAARAAAGLRPAPAFGAKLTRFQERVLGRFGA